MAFSCSTEVGGSNKFLSSSLKFHLSSSLKFLQEKNTTQHPRYGVNSKEASESEQC